MKETQHGSLFTDHRVMTTNGLVEGTSEPDAGLRSFKGIPFAAPPVGELRWKPHTTPLATMAFWIRRRLCAGYGPTSRLSAVIPTGSRSLASQPDLHRSAPRWFHHWPRISSPELSARAAP